MVDMGTDCRGPSLGAMADRRLSRNPPTQQTNLLFSCGAAASHTTPAEQRFYLLQETSPGFHLVVCGTYDTILLDRKVFSQLSACMHTTLDFSPSFTPARCVPPAPHDLHGAGLTAPLDAYIVWRRRVQYGSSSSSRGAAWSCAKGVKAICFFHPSVAAHDSPGPYADDDTRTHTMPAVLRPSK